MDRNDARTGSNVILFCNTATSHASRRISGCTKTVLPCESGAHDRDSGRRGNAGPDAMSVTTGDRSMNQVTKGPVFTPALSSPREPARQRDPIGAASAAIDEFLAQAHEAGDGDAVRLLHAVGAILHFAPRG